MTFRSRTIRAVAVAYGLFVGCSIGAFADEAEQKNLSKPEKLFATITTGGLTTPSYSVGSAICKRVNAKSLEHHVYCSILSSGGAIMNVDRLRRGNVTFALLKREDLKAAIEGSKIFANPRPLPNLRSVMSAYQLSFLVVAGADSGITDFESLKGRRVAVDSEGSDADNLLGRILQITRIDLSPPIRKPQDLIPAAICANEVDAGLLYGVQPNPALLKAAKQCGLKVFSLSESTVKTMADRFPDLMSTNVQAKTYSGQPADITAIGTDYVLTTTKESNPIIVKVIVESVLSQLPQLRKSDAALSHSTKEGLRPTVTFAPIFEGLDASYDE